MAVDPFAGSTWQPSPSNEPVYTDLFVNAVSGHDSAEGTISTPLATISEAQRRLNAPGVVTSNPTVHIVGDSPEAVDWCAVRTADVGSVSYLGTLTSVATGTLTAVTAFASGGPTEGAITDSGKASAFWTPYASGGYIVLLTSGVNTGAWAFVSQDLGSARCHHSPFYDPNQFSNITPTVGDAYAVMKLPVNSGGALTASAGNATLGQLAFSQALSIYSGLATMNACDMQAGANMVNVIVFLAGCRFGDDAILATAQQAAFDACFWIHRCCVISGGWAEFSALNYFKGASASLEISLGGFAKIDDGALFGVATAISVQLGARAMVGGLVYGTSSATNVIVIDGGCMMQLSSNANLPNVTGPSTYATIGGTAKTKGALSTSFVSTTNGAGVVYPAS